MGSPEANELGSRRPRKLEAALDGFFKVTAAGSTLRTELLAGATTFLTMAYIVVVNAQILSTTGMPEGAVVTATCLAAGFASILMGVWGRLPVGLAPGMGTNAYFAYFVCGTMGVPWPTALGAVFLSGLGFLLLSAFGLRARLVTAIPDPLKHGIAAGIGLFVAFVGLQNAGIVVDHPVTLVQLGALDDFRALVFAVGLVLTTGLAARGVRGAFLMGIAVTSALAVGLGIAAPPEGVVGLPPSLGPTFLALDFAGALDLGLLHLLFAFMFVDLFDTVATLVAVGEQGGLMVDREGRRELPGASRALGADAAGTMVGALLGTSTVTSYIESSSGIAAGGRTGLTAVVVGFGFLLTPFFAPLVRAVPQEATAPVLVIVAALMVRALARIRYDDLTDAVPAVVTCLAIPLTFSISDGLAVGFVTYPLVKIMAGRGREVSPVVALLGLAFVVGLLVLA